MPKFRIVPRVESVNIPILFLPDMPAKPGKIAYYNEIDGHGECSYRYFRVCTKPGDTDRAQQFAKAYASRFDQTDYEPVFRRRI